MAHPVTPGDPIPMGYDLRDERNRYALYNRTLTKAGNKVALAVTAGASSVVFTFPQTERDTSYGVSALPSWSTTTYCAAADKTTTQLTLHFGTAAPGGGGTVDILTFRSE